MSTNFTGTKGNVQPAESTMKFRRIITGHTSDGEAVFIEDKICQNRFAMGGNPEFCSTELWKMEMTPDDNTGDGKDPATSFTLKPPMNGNVFRVLELPPDTLLGTKEDGSPLPPTMHRTPSVDYAFVIKGKIYAILDKQELLMNEGDILIQRGTIHAWSNRSDKPAVILFVLCGAEDIPGLPPQ